MKLIYMSGGWHFNPELVRTIRPYSGQEKKWKTEIFFDKGDSFVTTLSPDEVRAKIDAAGTPLQDAVDKLIGLNTKHGELLAQAETRIVELTDRLTLFEAELKALQEIKLPDLK